MTAKGHFLPDLHFPEMAETLRRRSVGAAKDIGGLKGTAYPPCFRDQDESSFPQAEFVVRCGCSVPRRPCAAPSERRNLPTPASSTSSRRRAVSRPTARTQPRLSKRLPGRRMKRVYCRRSLQSWTGTGRSTCETPNAGPRRTHIARSLALRPCSAGTHRSRGRAPASPHPPQARSRHRQPSWANGRR